MRNNSDILSIFFTIVLLFSANSAFCSTFAKEIKLTGVFHSTLTKSALINGQVVGEGDSIGGIEILAIDHGEVRVLAASGEHALRVGGRAMLESPTETALRPASRVAPVAAAVRRVEYGDTLSDIAGDYVADGLSRSQVMIALYEANPEAFQGNVNRLKAGAELHIPDSEVLRRHDPELAVAAIVRHTEEWQSERWRQPTGTTRPPQHAEAEFGSADDWFAGTGVAADRYGPVQEGETLSEIAAGLSVEGAAMHQLMSAIFASNPEAFGDSVHLLRAGSVLRIPHRAEVNESATLTAHSY